MPDDAERGVPRRRDRGLQVGHVRRRAGLRRPDLAGHRGRHRRDLRRPVSRSRPDLGAARLPRGRRVRRSCCSSPCSCTSGTRPCRPALRATASTAIVADLWGGHTAYDAAQSRPGPSALVAVVGPPANLRPRRARLAAGRPGASAACRPCWSERSVLDQRLRRRSSTCCPACRWTAAPRRRRWSGGSPATATSASSRPAGAAGSSPCSSCAWALLLPLVQGHPPDLFTVVWAGLIGAFLWAGATQPSAPAAPAARWPDRHRLRMAPCRARCRPPAPPRTPWALRASGLGGVAVVVLGDRRLGAGPGRRPTPLLGIPGRRRAATPVTAVVRRQPAGGRGRRPRRPGHQPWSRRCRRCRSTRVPVRTGSGQVVGVVLADDLDAALSEGPRAHLDLPAMTEQPAEQPDQPTSARGTVPTGAARRRGPFHAGDRVQLTDPKGRLHTITLDRRASSSTPTAAPSPTTS